MSRKNKVQKVIASSVCLASSNLLNSDEKNTILQSAVKIIAPLWEKEYSFISNYSPNSWSKEKSIYNWWKGCITMLQQNKKFDVCHCDVVTNETVNPPGIEGVVMITIRLNYTPEIFILKLPPINTGKISS